MKHKKRLAIAGVAMAATLTLIGCGTPAGPSQEGEIVGREISWLLSRPADGGIITVVKEIADEYAETHPGFALNLVTTPDRPSYLQKLETLAAADQLPEFFDTDATPFTRKLVDQGKLVDVEALLKDLDIYDDFRPLALDYQRFDDGSLYMVPFEFEMEFFWYNTALFEQAGVTVPETLDDFADLCGPLRDAGVIPFALDGQDGWPLARYMSYQPFRLAGPDYLNELKRAEVELSDEVGTHASEWLAELGSSGCFAEGFSSQGYTDARDLFTSGQAAVYQIGTWELAALTSPDLPEGVKGNIDFFTLPTVEGAVTADNDYTVVSGIGMGISQKAFDPLVEDFLKFLLSEYSDRIVETGHMSPIAGSDVVIPEGASELYARALAEVDNLGDETAFPWDTQLDPTTNSRLQQDLVLLVQGEITPEQFTKTIDATLAENAPKFFD
ncbi:ABC transporter substrate-binding protein [Pseudolysinimonas yzui]|jgi:raffinose/stachyose/melibiose transport system substrate-binding protein|uniref:Sugar ABC transporter substrate-binding protein n=1 Tax=Pseudolysinimonas yzui TaxID=2708254 RepID=A0A8J3DZJ1_9MICO|nr:sugar ABC transporter substrate-binding protein [Pseudolysinimonas yzui]